MVSVALVVGLFFSPVSAIGAADLPSTSAVAAAAGRPRECASSGRRARKPTVWQRAKSPSMPAYCDGVARAITLLEQDAKGALDAAEKADEAWPGHAGARAVVGRAKLALGKPDLALAAFDEARALDPNALEDPKAMRDYARALVGNGKLERAAEIYRTLVPRAGLLPERVRASVLLEAAFAVMADARSAPADTMRARLTEVDSYLAEARGEAGSASRGDVLLASALVHDRLGDGAKTVAFLAEAVRTGVVPRDPSVPYAADAADRDAMNALGLEPHDPAGAAAAWQRYLEASKGTPFEAAARARLAALPKTPQKSGPKPKKPAKP